MSKRLLIVGAGGFIGGFIARRGLQLGYDTWVAVRETTSRRYLDDPRLHFLVLDYEDTDDITRKLTDAMPATERWDYIIYNLGATKCVNFADFNRINYQYLRNFTDALQQSRRIPSRFLYVSSLSALGPVRETDGLPIDGTEVPLPDTRYGVSKIKAETLLETIPGLPYIIFRPTGVYGPHEQDYLMMIKSIDSHWDFGVGYKKQMLTFIYVEDLVDAMFAALESGVMRKKYIISEDAAYTQEEFRSIVAKELGVKWVIPVKLPLWMAYVASVVAEKWGLIRLKPSTLNRDKYKIMRQRNWSCDISAARDDFGFTPRFSLADGIRETVRSYRQSNKQK